MSSRFRALGSETRNPQTLKPEKSSPLRVESLSVLAVELQGPTGAEPMRELVAHGS